jgi:hypothetical protein
MFGGLFLEQLISVIFSVTVFTFVLMLSNFSFAGPSAYGITAIGYLLIRCYVDFVFIW